MDQADSDIVSHILQFYTVLFMKIWTLKYPSLFFTSSVPQVHSRAAGSTGEQCVFDRREHAVSWNEGKSGERTAGYEALPVTLQGITSLMSSSRVTATEYKLTPNVKTTEQNIAQNGNQYYSIIITIPTNYIPTVSFILSARSHLKKEEVTIV